MRTVVIGATGHIGTWLVPRLVRGGHDVIAVSRGGRAPYHGAPEWDAVERVTIDRTAAELDGSFGETIAEFGADTVVDLISFDPRSTASVVDALRGKIGHFIHCGTLWVHGNPRRRPYTETEPREPFGEYGVLKAEIERLLLHEAERGFPATVLHPGHITGPGWAPINPAGHLDPSVFTRLSRGDEVALPDDGRATLQHVHADDVAAAFELAVENRDAAIGESFHVAASEPVTMRDFASAAARWWGRDADIAFLPWDEWKETVSAYDAMLTRDHMLHSPHASIAKAQQLLGFSPRYSAVEAVKSTVLPDDADGLPDWQTSAGRG